ncbi:hypothetical protein [Actinoalloteichus hymeniacidonis]|uniref:hypothetical protein n=1 Tax=Actinoalloteichus hymeniacidonis TaxID=340345 RepID=UPI00085327CE|nr:hypothetical protein [Actinoalloteichus hymeniacidonis]MBB5906211.1 hypothetical protein [Actinoalloteichus hymeniacidonis]
MNARTGSIAGRSPGDRSSRGRSRSNTGHGGSDSSGRAGEAAQRTDLFGDPAFAGLRIALAVAAIGALLAMLALPMGLTAPSVEPAFGSWPLLALLDILPVALAVLFAVRGRSAAAIGLLIASAAVAPGRALLDAVLLVDPVAAVRPELVLFDSLESVSAGLGAYLLLAARLAALVAGILAFRAVDRDVRGSTADIGAVETPEPAGSAVLRSNSPGGRPGIPIGPLCFIVAACLGLAGAPVSSDNPYLLPHAVLDTDGLTMVGWMVTLLGLIAAALLAPADPAADSPSGSDRVLGGLLGTGLMVIALAAPFAAAGLFGADLGPTSGPIFALVAAAGLLLLALRVALRSARRTSTARTGEVTLPATGRLRRAAGVLALLAGVALFLGVLLPSLAPTSELIAEPANHQASLLVPAGGLLTLLGIGLLLPWGSTIVRPAFVVAWLAAPMVAAVALDVVFAANQLVGAGLGAGAWLIMAAVPLASTGAFLAWTAGAVEREDVDLSEWPTDRVALVPAVAGVLWAAGAFLLPVLESEEFAPAGVLENFQIASWAQILGLLGVLGASALAPRARPVQAAGLFLGAAALLVLRVLEFPLTAARALDAQPGPGLWLGACGIVALLAGAGIVLRVTRRDADPSHRR